MRYSKDSLIRVAELKEFLKNHQDFFDIDSNAEQEMAKPEPYTHAYYFDSSKLVYIYHDGRSTNYGMDIVEKLGFIEVAFRDGVTEYEFINRRIAIRERQLQKDPSNDRAKTVMERLEALRKALTPFKPQQEKPKPKRFSDYLVDTGQKYEWSYSGDYVVLDLETNGLRWTKDDLLSISIYSPKTGICYNRFLPLEQQPVVLTGWINGIRTKDLENEAHLSQEEFDWLIKEFHLDEITILVYSGGDGNFDLDFLKNYCKRQKIVECEKLKVTNIKNHVPKPGTGTEGQCTKDNLCRIFGIEGVSKVHASMQDCILEWRLFDALMTRKVFFVDNHLMEYVDGYVIPISYLLKHQNLAKYAGISLPRIKNSAELVFSYDFPDRLINRIRKFPTNITGISVENAIYAMLGAKEQDNYEFLCANRMKLKYVGSLDKNIEVIPIVVQNDGTIRTTDERFEGEVDEVNKVTEIIKQGLKETVGYIQNEVFKGKALTSQEMVVSENGKVLALCDLSSEEAVLEIKTANTACHSSGGKMVLYPDYAYQLYYQANGRKTFLLHIDLAMDWTQEKEISETISRPVKSISIKLFEVKLDKQSETGHDAMISPFYKPFFDVIKENPRSSYATFMLKTGYARLTVQLTLSELKQKGFIERVGSKAAGSWVILKEPDYYD